MSCRNEGIHKDTIRDACPAGTGMRLFMEKEAHYFDVFRHDCFAIALYFNDQFGLNG